jgi:hypothetical protein
MHFRGGKTLLLEAVSRVRISFSLSLSLSLSLPLSLPLPTSLSFSLSSLKLCNLLLDLTPKTISFPLAVARAKLFQMIPSILITAKGLPEERGAGLQH